MSAFSGKAGRTWTVQINVEGERGRGVHRPYEDREREKKGEHEVRPYGLRSSVN